MPALTPAQLASYHATGYLIIPQLLAPDEVATIRETFMAMNAHGPVPGLSETARNAVKDGQVQFARYDASDPLAFYARMMHPHRHPDKPVGPLALRYLLDPRIHDILAALFEDEPIAAQSMFYFKPPGARGQDFHQDNFYLRVRPGTCMAAWIAIDDADADNGGMIVAPGSHTMDVLCPEKTTQNTTFFTTEHVEIPAHLRPVQTVLRAGDVLFFNGSLIHGSYPNKSNRFRRSLINHYIPQSCIEVATWYKPLLTFTGQEVAREAATGGGPCGTLQEAKGPH